MNPTSGLWRALAFGAGTRYRTLTVEGWEELPPARYEKMPRANSHGAHPSRVLSDERIVTITGFCWSSTERDQLVAEMQQNTAFRDDDVTEPLTLTVAGRTLTAGAQMLAARAALLRGEWGIGRFGWLLQWRCPDPLRYGATRSVPTGLPTSGGGMALPLFATGGMDFGALGDTGQVTVSNAGTAPAPILLGVRGGLPLGFEISAAGQRLTYPVEVPSGQVVEIDTAAGSVLVEGTASRRANLTRADWMLVPARDRVTGAPSSLTLQFSSMGGAYDPAARLEATVTDTYW